MNDYTVEIESKHEGVTYRDQERVCHFGLHQDGNGWLILPAYSWSDADFTEHETTPEIRDVVVPRILAYLKQRGSRVSTLMYWPDDPIARKRREQILQRDKQQT